MNINENILKITGGAYLNEAFQTDHRAHIEADLECYSVEKRDNQDGTYNLVNKAKIVSEVVVTQGDKIIRGRTKNSLSQRFRGRVCGYAKDDLGETDPEAYYESFMKKAIAYVPELCEYLKNKS